MHTFVERVVCMSEVKKNIPFDVNVRLDADLSAFLDREAAREGESKSVIVRRALREYRKRLESSQNQSEKQV